MRNQRIACALFGTILALTISACGTTSSSDLAPDPTGETSASSTAVVADASAASEDVAPADTSAESSDDAAQAASISATPAESAAESSVSEAPPESVADTDEDLGVILSEIAENVHAGESGSSLKSTIAAADLLDFTMQTDLSAEEIEAQTAQYFAALPEEARMEYPDQVMFVGEAIHTLRDGDADALLESAGVTDSAYPWTDDAYEKADAILMGCGI